MFEAGLSIPARPKATFIATCNRFPQSLCLYIPFPNLHELWIIEYNYGSKTGLMIRLYQVVASSRLKLVSRLNLRLLFGFEWLWHSLLISQLLSFWVGDVKYYYLEMQKIHLIVQSIEPVGKWAEVCRMSFQNFSSEYENAANSFFAQRGGPQNVLFRTCS